MKNSEATAISNLAIESFKKISPFWPLKNLIAVNPLQGLEDLPIENALKIGAVYFEQAELPEKMEKVNCETIKWLQVLFDEGQATISMPFKEKGLYTAWRQLSMYDAKLHNNDKYKRNWLKNLPEKAELTISICLLHLGIAKEDHQQFATLMLTTLPGWAAHVKYRTEWSRGNANHSHPVNQADYLAIRIIITALLWPESKELLVWHESALRKSEVKTSVLEHIQTLENDYHFPLLEKLARQPVHDSHVPEAQLVFCIDVRSEPFRRALESTGDYQTFGFAGFFGIPVQITDTVKGESYASCPVLLSPKHEVKESPCEHKRCEHISKDHERVIEFQRLYQSLKYTFTTPFALVETLGIASGMWMGLRSFSPKLASILKNTITKTISKSYEVAPSLEDITLAEQCSYAQNALTMMGLTHHFATIVVLCGHGSTTQNNAYATALDCGACGGRHGGSNARILAMILNRSEVRRYLKENGIDIPKTTRFIAAEHNTTTDEMTIYGHQDCRNIQKLKENLEKVRITNSSTRLDQMQKGIAETKAASKTRLRSLDWAQVRPEWGLAGNAAFIVGPRDITASLDLEGRCFLHSYDYTNDPEGSYLTTILTAPMVVAQWINTQYLFSTMNNVAYGGGSKITKNITGKMGIMQGNASDLMTGLPLQSVYSSDTEAYHQTMRLMTVVYAPIEMLDSIIQAQPVLQKLFCNGWIKLACIEPDTRKIYLLNRDFTWQSIH
ncbi:MAG: DUF2309 domain-containing protein [Candidatus Paracaedibacteraceae bacterium]|nr:DUF2309 domain-containing protein [Candidatus Paracaedibacteraceae bacterium]